MRCAITVAALFLTASHVALGQGLIFQTSEAHCSALVDPSAYAVDEAGEDSDPYDPAGASKPRPPLVQFGTTVCERTEDATAIVGKAFAHMSGTAKSRAIPPSVQHANRVSNASQVSIAGVAAALINYKFAKRE